MRRVALFAVLGALAACAGKASLGTGDGGGPSPVPPGPGPVPGPGPTPGPTPTPAEIQLQITSPVQGSVLSGATTLSLNVSGLNDHVEVGFLLDDHPLVNNGEPVPFRTGPVASYVVPWHTANVYDGYAKLQAVVRDAAGGVVKASDPVIFRIANGTVISGARRVVTVSLQSPDVGAPLGGQVDFVVRSDYALGAGENYVWGWFVDGVGSFNWDPRSSFPVRVDTTKLANGRHEFYVLHLVETPSGTSTAGMFQTSFTADNGRTAMELRPNFGDVYLVPAERATLSARLVYTNGDEEPVAAPSFSSGNPGVVTVSGAGQLTGVAPGKATVTVSAGGRTAQVTVRVKSAKTYPHFSKTGDPLTSYVPGQSTFMRTMFDLNPYEVDDALGAAMQAAAVNVISTGFYRNPADGAPSDFNSWKSSFDMNARLITDVASKFGLGIYLTGDEIARTRPELSSTVMDAASADKLRYAMSWARNTARALGVDMVDEVDMVWGNTPTPNDGRWSPIPDSAFTTIMQIVNSAAARPNLTWSVLGVAGPSATAAWTGNPSFSDYSGIYWDNRDDRKAYPWGAGLMQVIEGMDASVIGREGLLQEDRPGVLLTACTGVAYLKGGSGQVFQAGQDQVDQPPTRPEAVAMEIMHAALRGMAGVRVYSYDAQHSKNARRSGGTGSFQQTFCDPTTVGVARWRAMAAAFQTVAALEPFLLQPPTHALALGRAVVTAARAGANGKLFMAINAAEVPQVIRPDLSSYVGQSGNAWRYRVVGSRGSSARVDGISSDTVTLEPGETVLYAFAP